jgi:hypothetical protein
MFRSLNSCPTITTLLTGSSKSQSSCHKALLGFYSDFFYAALYGGFKEAATKKITLSEHVAEEVQVFVSWVYTGRIAGEVKPEKLWVLGDNLGSPLFMNEAMHLLFRKYDGNWIFADDADYVYKNTAQGSKLREFILEVILTNGPLSVGAKCDGGGDIDNWCSLIRRGGDIVVDVARKGCFSKVDEKEEEVPYDPKYQDKYLVPEKTRDVDEFIQGKMQGSTG